MQFEGNEETHVALGNNIVLSTENEEEAKQAIDNRDYRLILNMVLVSFEVLNNLKK